MNKNTLNQDERDFKNKLRTSEHTYLEEVVYLLYDASKENPLAEAILRGIEHEETRRINKIREAKGMDLI